eukprot:scpid98589/ scgid20089/ 
MLNPSDLKFPVASGAYPYLKRLVLTGGGYLHVESEKLLEILENNAQITQLSVALQLKYILVRRVEYDTEFFEKFSCLKNKFTHLDTCHWITAAPCDAFVEMAGHFPLLRDFSYLYRSHWIPYSYTLREYPRDGTKDSAEMLVADCPNLSCLTIGGAIGIPSRNTTRRKYWTQRERIVLRDNFGSLSTLGKLSRLHSLSLQGMSLCSETDLEMLASQLPQLECLHLSDIHCESFQYIPRLGAAIRQLRNLKTLTVLDSNVQIDDLFQSMGELTQLDNFSLH